MAEIRVKDNESLDSALRRFKRSCARSGVLAERLLVSASSSNLDLYCNRKKGRWVYPVCLFHLHRAPPGGRPCAPLVLTLRCAPGSPRRFGAPAFPHRGCRPAGGPIGQPSPLRCARLSPLGLPPRRGPHRAALAASARPPFLRHFRPPGAFFSPHLLL